MQIAKDTFVIIEYTVQLADGSFVKGENGRPSSMNFIVGYNEILPGLERRLFGLEEGGTARFVVPAGEAFGERDESLVRTRSFSEFSEGRSLPVGKWVIASNDTIQAKYSYLVKEKTDEGVILDFNHPLAGKDLHYDVKVIYVRKATQDELAHLRPCEFEENREA